MARPTLGDEPLSVTVRFRLSESERRMLADLAPDGRVSALLRRLIRREHAILGSTPHDSVEH